jgi:poly(A) polymerase
MLKRKPGIISLNPDSSDITAQAANATARIIPRAEHPISRKFMSPNALRVLYKLREGGHQAFLVGGCLRDVFLGIEPKDFDVATSASPEEVKRLFRNCRLIGRRFRLAHVFFGREIIEVATFRASSSPSQGEEPDADPDILPEVGAVADDGDDTDDSLPMDTGDDDQQDRLLDGQGRILRDNTYGTLDDDVWRRDFTCNALYYNIDDFSLLDYVGGFEDIAARRLSLIGDPETRYREDPVRMLRAARFEAKLGFTLAPATEAPIAPLRELLAQVPAARLFDETLKLFLTGHGAKSLAVLQRRGLLRVLFPTVGQYLDRHTGSLVEKLLVAGLENTDARVLADKPVTPTFLFSLLLYGPIAAHIEAQPQDRWHDTGTILDACDRAVYEAQQRVTIPKRFSLGIRDMFGMQPRLEQPRGRRALRTLELPKFRAAYDLLVLRAKIGMASPATAEWWTRLQDVTPEQRAHMIDQLERSQANAPEQEASGGSEEGGSSSGGRRRRPRRRRPAGGA